MHYRVVDREYQLMLYELYQSVFVHYRNVQFTFLPEESTIVSKLCEVLTIVKGVADDIGCFVPLVDGRAHCGMPMLVVFVSYGREISAASARGYVFFWVKHRAWCIVGKS